MHQVKAGPERSERWLTVCETIARATLHAGEFLPSGVELGFEALDARATQHAGDHRLLLRLEALEPRFGPLEFSLRSFEFLVRGLQRSACGVEFVTLRPFPFAMAVEPSLVRRKALLTRPLEVREPTLNCSQLGRRAASLLELGRHFTFVCAASSASRILFPSSMRAVSHVLTHQRFRGRERAWRTTRRRRARC